MFCSSCGHKNVDEAAFCARCGLSLKEEDEPSGEISEAPEAAPETAPLAAPQVSVRDQAPPPPPPSPAEHKKSAGAKLLIPLCGITAFVFLLILIGAGWYFGKDRIASILAPGTPVTTPLPTGRASNSPESTVIAVLTPEITPSPEASSPVAPEESPSPPPPTETPEDLTIETLTATPEESPIATPEDSPELLSPTPTPREESPSPMLTRAPVSRPLKIKLHMNKSLYRIGDKAAISLTASRDAYFVVYSLNQKGIASVLAPSEFCTSKFVRSGSTLVFRDYNGNLVEQYGPPGTEHLQVMASDKPIDMSMFNESLSYAQNKVRQRNPPLFAQVLIENLKAKIDKRGGNSASRVFEYDTVKYVVTE